MLGSGLGFSAGVQSGQNFPLGGFGTHGLLRVAPLQTNCWPEAPQGGRVVGVRGPAESPPPPRDQQWWCCYAEAPVDVHHLFTHAYMHMHTAPGKSSSRP